MPNYLYKCQYMGLYWRECGGVLYFAVMAVHEDTGLM